MSDQVSVNPNAQADLPQDEYDKTDGVVDDLAYQRLAIVNVVYVGQPNAADGEWILVDAGVMGSAGSIERAADERFGKGSRPAAIVLTHGHFDHVGALRQLAEKWNVPIYAHPQELRYLDGTSAYPPPDPSVGGGLMAALSRFYPRDPIDVSQWLRPLPSGGSIPFMPGWQWLHTPGHTAGHISLWREHDRLLIAGDAFITTDQESAYAVVVQRPELHGPPAYFTPNWKDAQASVERLAALEPEYVVTGHGPSLCGDEMRRALHTLATNFADLAIPEQGRYVEGELD